MTPMNEPEENSELRSASTLFKTGKSQYEVPQNLYASFF